MTLSFKKQWMLPAGPVLAAVVGFWLRARGLDTSACWCAGVTVLCGIWWMFESIPLPATGLVPFAVFPLAGILNHREIAHAYGHTLILLMLAGSMVSAAMEKSGAHRRIALGMVRMIGTDARRLILGFLVTAAVLSMWVSNTATVLMLLPVALAVLDQAPDRSRLAPPLLLAVAYGAAVGGSGTPIGTPPNLIMIENYREATGIEIGFPEWMRMGLPATVLMLPIVWLWLSRGLSRDKQRLTVPDPGDWQPDQKRVLIIFGLTALAWMTRTAPFGGWSEWLQLAGQAGDSTVALAAVVALFILPSGSDDGSRLLDWETANRIPWGLFSIIGGGVAIGMAFRETDLSAAVGRELLPLAALPLPVMIFCLCLFATFFTEFATNTAVAGILMPVMAAVATSANVNPMLVMIPVTLGLNWSFMLPAATVTNAMVYGTGEVTIQRMMREGFVLNLIGAVLVSAVCYLTLS